MATLLTFHAHPDDEVIATGGTMAKAAAAGHRVVLVTATAGENGEVAPDVLTEGEALGDRRRSELEAAAALLGAARVEVLGFRDSGMMGTPANDDPACFWQADVEEAAGRLARILEEERPDAFTIYDPNGTYGHPDHIQVHRVGARAAEIAGVERVFEATVNRDNFRRFFLEAVAAGVIEAPTTEGVGDDMGLPEAVLTTRVDVSSYVDLKREALRAHASQIPPGSFFLTMPAELFATIFGTEWYRRLGAPAGELERDLL